MQRDLAIKNLPIATRFMRVHGNVCRRFRELAAARMPPCDVKQTSGARAQPKDIADLFHAMVRTRLLPVKTGI
jgi:hypothetical protein